MMQHQQPPHILDYLSQHYLMNLCNSSLLSLLISFQTQGIHPIHCLTNLVKKYLYIYIYRNSWSKTTANHPIRSISSESKTIPALGAAKIFTICTSSHLWLHRQVLSPVSPSTPCEVLTIDDTPGKEHRNEERKNNHMLYRTEEIPIHTHRVNWSIFMFA